MTTLTVITGGKSAKPIDPPLPTDALNGVLQGPEFKLAILEAQVNELLVHWAQYMDARAAGFDDRAHVALGRLSHRMRVLRSALRPMPPGAA